MEFKLELFAVPVSDIDRAKAFYEKVGFNADHDHEVNENLRFVQLTPPGSACSICIGKGLTDVKPGSLDMILLVVENAAAAREELKGRGIDVSEVEELEWGKFVYFSDPDGNRWSVQELPKRI
jgi:predicted enzyme related to lactoylglutathione lyase